MGFIKRAFDFARQPSHSRTMGLVVMLLLATAVSLTVYVAQQQQQLRQRASEFCEGISALSECSVFGLSSQDIESSDCSTFNENFQCKIGNKIYECKKQ